MAIESAGRSEDLNRAVACVGLLLLLFCYRIWDLGTTHTDDAGWLLHTLQGNWRDGWEMALFQGRVWAFVSGPLLNIAMYLQGTVGGEIYRVGCLAIFFILFYGVLSIYTGRGLATLAAGLNLALFALRWEGSMVTTYPAMFGVQGTLFMLALWCYWKYSRAGAPRFLVLGIAALFLSLFMHEGVTLLYCIAAPVAIIGNHFYRPSAPATLRSITSNSRTQTQLVAAFTVIATYSVLYFGWRWAFPSGYEGNTLATFSAKRIASTFFSLSTSGSVLSDIARPYHVRFSDAVLRDGYTITYRFRDYLTEHWRGPAALSAALISSCVIFLAGRSMDTLGPASTIRPTAPLWMSVILGLAIATAPVLPVALTAKYQQQFFDLQVGSHVYTALSHFGWTLVIAALMAGLFSLAGRGTWVRKSLVICFSAATGVLAYGSYQMNDAIASDIGTETSRWKSVEQAQRLISGNDIRITRFYAPRLSGGSWFTAVPETYWTEYLRARGGAQFSFNADSVPLDEVRAGKVAMLDFFLPRRGAQPVVIVAPLELLAGKGALIAPRIYIRFENATPSERSQYTLSYTDVRNGPTSVRLSQLQDGSKGQYLLDNVQASPVSIRVSPGSTMNEMRVACHAAANGTTVAVGPLSSMQEPLCIGDILMRDDEFQAIEWQSISAFLGGPVRRSREGSWRTETYPFAIYSSRSLASSTISKPFGLLILPRQIPHAIGTVQQSSQALWLEARPGQQGALAFGPYVSLEKGRYEAAFQLTADGVDAQESVGEIDVAVNGGQRIVSAEITSSPKEKLMVLPFKVAGSALNYEFRVFTKGNATLKLKAVMLRQLPEK
jgi:hypothetical protein